MSTFTDNLTLFNGSKMPIIGLGTWQGSDEELEKGLNWALEIGYRHIDTAFSYKNEKVIGKVLNEWFSRGKLRREQVFLVTKLPIVGVHPDRVEMFMKKSLENLQVQYVDLYLVHFPVGAKYQGEGIFKPLNAEKQTDLEGRTDFVALWRKMEEQVKNGRAKAIGVSNFSIKQINAILEIAEIKPANQQIEMHLYLQQEEMLRFCNANKITIAAYAPLGSPAYNQFLKSYNIEERPIPRIFENETVVAIAKKHAKTAGQIAIRFLLQQGVAAIPKSTSEARLKENFDVFDFALDGDDVEALKRLDLGEQGRIFTFSSFPGIEKHPDFPF